MPNPCQENLAAAPPVKIAFECLPLRSIGRLDIPIDASPEYRARCERIKLAMQTHGLFNSYYLVGGRCEFRLTNHDTIGLLRYEFEGALLTDADDRRARHVDFEVRLAGESCDWLTKPAAEWFQETVRRAVAVEFDRYIAAGDLAKTLARLEKIQHESDAIGGYLGMHL